MHKSFLQNLTERQQPSSFFEDGGGVAKRLLPFAKVQELYDRVHATESKPWFESLLDEMRITLRVADRDLRRVPKSGAVLAVANHPYGMLDGAVLAALLGRVRADVKIMTNFLLNGFAELQEHCIFVDPFQQEGSAERNRLALQKALRWLRDGHVLAVFPAGEVSHLQLPRGTVSDPKWNPMIARLARSTGACALPVFFGGGNSLAFHTLSLIHRELRTIWLINEFLNQRGKTIDVRIGTPVSRETMADMPSEDGAIEYLRRRTYLLSRRPHNSIPLKPVAKFPFPRKSGSIAPATEKKLLAAEIQQLDSDHLLEDSREFSVYVARATEIPNVVQEVGRLREITFREVGEGSGRSRDLDEFDDYYLHLLLWDKQKEQVAGAYRMGICPQILATRGPRGLYTSTLFHYRREFFEKLGPALELGRSFVIPEYQRKFASLLLLWKGIGRYISRHPETPVVFGAVSISRVYNSASRELIVKYFESQQRGEIARFVRPRRPFRPLPFQPWDCASTSRVLRDLEDLGDSVSDMETDAKGIPVLVRQYVKLGGRLLAFNVDRNFSDVLDGLVLLDLRETDPAALQRYMGVEGLERLYQYHGLTRTWFAACPPQQTQSLHV